MSSSDGLDEVDVLRAELTASRAENEMLLQQITRLCLFVERRMGCDPIAIMYARDDEIMPANGAQSAPAPASESSGIGGWVYRKLVGTSNTSQQRDHLPLPSAAPGSSGASHSPLGPESSATALMSDPMPSDYAPDDESCEQTVDEAVAAGTILRWHGEPEAIKALEEVLLQSRYAWARRTHLAPALYQPALVSCRHRRVHPRACVPRATLWTLTRRSCAHTHTSAHGRA